MSRHSKNQHPFFDYSCFTIQCNNNRNRKSAWWSIIVMMAVVQGILRTVSIANTVMDDYHQELVQKMNSSLMKEEVNQKVQEQQQQQETNKRNPYLPYQHVLEQPKSWETMIIQTNSIININNSNAKRRPLNFLHIPKTGGTSIVMAAANANVAWGDCLFWFNRERKNCPNRPINYFANNNSNNSNTTTTATTRTTTFPIINDNNNNNNNNIRNLYHPEQYIKFHPMLRSWWHMPIQFIPNDRKHINPYQHQDLFAVIRNPYQRVVSQYYYRCLRDADVPCYLGKNNKYRNQDTPQQMNTVIQQMIRKQQRATIGSKEYFYHDGHWIPQAHYVYSVTTNNNNNNNNNNNKKNDNKNKNFKNIKNINKNKQLQQQPQPKNNIRPSSFQYRRLVQHILHFEYLQEEFDSLMSAYQLNITLPKQKMLDRNEYPTACSVKNLTQTTLRLIEDVYRDDFQLGGYPILSRKS